MTEQANRIDDTTARLTAPIMTSGVAERLVASENDYLTSLLTGVKTRWPELPGIETRAFGKATAHLFSLNQDPHLNRTMGLRAEDRNRVEEILDFYRAVGISPAIDLCPYFADGPLFARLADSGLAPHRVHSVLYGTPSTHLDRCADDITVHLVDSDERWESFADIFTDVHPIAQELRQPFHDTILAQYRQDHWRCYLASVDSTPAAMGAMYVKDGVASLATGATLPEWRGRGCQSALLRRRIADAARSDCDLVTSFTEIDTISQRNMERAGLRHAYTKIEFRPTTTAKAT